MALTIQLRNIPPGIPPEWLFDGMLFVDVDDRKTATRLSKGRAQQSETGKIKGEASFPITLTKTEKNKFILQQYIRISVLDQTFDLIPVLAVDGFQALPFDVLAIQGIDDTQNAVVGQLIKSEEFWLKKARKLFLKDIPGNSFTFTPANIEGQWGQVRYNDPADPEFNFAPIHWGRPPDKTDNFLYQPEFLRPLFNVRAVLDKGFCSLGYSFRSPIMETNYASQWWTYILAKDFYDYEGKGVGTFDFQAELTGGGWDDSTPPNFDSAGNFATGRYDNLTGGEIEMGFEININQWENPFGNGLTFEIRLGVVDTNPSPVEGVGEDQVFQFFVLPGDTFDGAHRFDIVNLKPNWGAGPTFWAVDYTVEPATEVQIFTILGTTFKSYFIESKHIFQGDTIQPWTMISPDYTFDKFAKGVSELFGGMWWEDPARREVWLFQKLEADVYDQEGIEGFITGDKLDWRDNKIIHKSRKAKFPTAQKKRFVRFQFKNHTDGFINTLDYADDFPIYSRTVDFQVGTNQTEVRKNSFFEPTADINWNAITIPAMWDGEGSKTVGEGKEGYNIKPRILYAVGLRKQVVPESENLDDSTLAQWNWNGDPEQKDLPYYSQDPFRPTSGDGLTLYPRESIVYGFKANDLYTMFLKVRTIQERRMAEEDFLVLMNPSDYGFLTFRDYLLIHYEGSDFISEPIAVKDFQPGSRTPTPITIQPVPQLSTIPECVPPSAFKTCTFSMAEDSAWLISETDLDNTVACSIDALVVNGTNILGLLPVQFILTPGNITTVNLGGTDIVTNYVDTLTALNLPFFTFEIVASPSGKCGGGIRITWPEVWSWQLRFNFNLQMAVSFADPMTIFSDGATTVYISEVATVPDCGITAETDGRWTGSEDCFLGDPLLPPTAMLYEIDPSLGVVIMDTDKVDSIADQTGNGYNMLAVAGINRPLYTPGGLDGNPTVKYSRSIPWRTWISQGINITPPYTNVIVMKEIISGSQRNHIYETTAKIRFRHLNTGEMNYDHVDAFDVFTNDANFHIYIFAVDGTNSYTSIDGVVTVRDYSNALGDTQSFYFSGNASGNNASDMEIAYHSFYKRRLDNDELAELAAFLNFKFPSI